ncbi:DUF4861 family protein [candidate division KSB1 bacterium]
MKKSFIIYILLLIFHSGNLLCAGTQIQHIDFLVQNSKEIDYKGVVWIDADDVYSLIPGFDGFSFLVTTTDSPDMVSDLKKKQARILPSQALDDNFDGKVERIGIYVSIKAQSNKVVTLQTGQVDRIMRLKPVDRKLCDAVLMNNNSGLFWESDRIGYRYDRSGNSINVFGKMTHRSIISEIISPGYDLSKMTVLGKEYKLGTGEFGFGGLGVLEDEQLRLLSNRNVTKMAVNGHGPIAACVNVSLIDESDSGERVSVDIQYLLSRDSRWTWVNAQFSGDWRNRTFVTGIPVRSGEQELSESGIIATIADSPLLGLAVYVPEKYLAVTETRDGYHTAILKLDENGHVEYGFAGYWEMEHWQNVVAQGELDILMPKTYYMDRYEEAGWMLMRPPPIDSPGKFKGFLGTDLTWIKEGHPGVKPISEKAVTYAELLPPEAVKANRRKSYNEALNLLIDRLRMFAEEGFSEKGEEKFWVTSKPDGKPSFVRPNRSWGDGYWVSMLWDAYHVTGDSKFKEWALKSNRLMLGGEGRHSHVTGLNYRNASVRTYLETKDKIWRDSALKSADVFLQIAHPSTGFVPGNPVSSRENADNPYDAHAGFYIDAMICIPVLWWAYQETGDKRYLDIADRHTAATAENLVEPDGSVFQLLWYHPKTGEVIGRGTTQGYAGNTRWSRGHAWVMDGFPDAYKATGKKLYLDVFRRSAFWLIDNLPQDFVPWYDYDDQAVIYRHRDTSAGAICAFGLMRMADLETDPGNAKRFKETAVNIVDALIDNYLTPVGSDDARPSGMLSNQCYVKHNWGEQIWGSFNFMKALLWLREKGIERE